MTTLELVKRTLFYFARANVAIVAGVIVATATITGALLVGDSVRGSLRDMTLARLGNIEHVLTGPRFLTDRTALRLAPEAVPALLLTGTVKANDRVAGSVQIVAIPEDAGPKLWPDAAFTLSDRSIVLNNRVALALAAKAEDRVSILVEIPDSVPRDSLLGERDEVLTELNFDVAEILPESSGAGRFSLSPAQQIPPVVFVSLRTLQDALDISEIAPTRRQAGRIGRVNTVFVPVESGLGETEVNETLQSNGTLDDIDVRLIESESSKVLSVESRSQIVPEAIAAAAHSAAETQDKATNDVLVYLVNEIAPVEAIDAVAAGDSERFSTYSVLAGVESLSGFVFRSGEPTTALKSDEIVINEWLADDLDVGVGDQIRLTYLEVGDTGDLPELSADFKVAGIVAMDGAATDRTLTPTVPGITDADTFADWEQPYTMDLNRVTDRDEDYWELYRATPKMFVSLAEMQRRFGSRYGNVTSVRIDDAEVNAIGQGVLESVELAKIGLNVINIRAAQLEAASGTTDFSGLFFGFSLFLIASAVLLIGLLFRLSVETRVRQFGLLRSVGWSPALVRGVLLREGLLLAVVGGVAGVVAAVLYAGVMLYGLTTWWGGATGTQFLSLHVGPTSLVAGLLIAVVVSLGTMWTGIRLLIQQEPKRLLGGEISQPLSRQKRSRLAFWTAVISLPVAGATLLLLLVNLIPQGEAFAGFSLRVVGFFVTGGLFLVGGLAAFAMLIEDSTSDANGLSLAGLGIRNLGRARNRSLLTVCLMACSTFLLVAVAVAKKDPTAEEPERDSGNGGYRIVAESATPILTDISTASGRFDAQFVGDRDAAAFEHATITSLRVRPGDDASCLNLYSARLPKLLGVPADVLKQWHEESRFRFADTPGDSPWLTLLEPGNAASRLVIPAIGDMNTLLYSLHTGVGKEVAVPVEVHPDATLKITGMLDSSVFQGVLLMSDDNLRKLDPAIAGYRYFLIDCDEATADEITQDLETGFADYGFDAEPVGARIADFLAVQNTYLTTFQALGGLGLLLGTLGLGTVMLRNVVERVGELALMRAIGFSPGRIRSLILGESVSLLFAGLVLGTATALLAMAPHILSSGAIVPWSRLLVLLIAVAIAGLASTVLAVRRATNTSVIAALKSE